MHRTTSQTAKRGSRVSMVLISTAGNKTMCCVFDTELRLTWFAREAQRRQIHWEWSQKTTAARCIQECQTVRQTRFPENSSGAHIDTQVLKVRGCQKLFDLPFLLAAVLRNFPSIGFELSCTSRKPTKNHLLFNRHHCL